MIKNVAIYCRVSTEEQRKFGISVEDQKNSLTKYCKDNKLKIYDYYIDEGVSAGTISKRKEFVRLLKELDNIDLIIFTKLDRFSRNVRDANNLLVELDAHKTSFKAIDEDDIDTSTADGRFIFNLKVNLAEHERNKDSERINRVNKYKYHIARTVCSGQKIFGYDINEKKQYVVNEKEAQQIKDLFNEYIKTNSLVKTADWFKENVGNKSVGQIRNYLLEKKYIGIFTTTRDKEELTNFIPRILDDETFYKVQNLIQKNVRQFNLKNNQVKKVHIFSGLIICGECGYKMAGGNQGKERNYNKIYKCKQHSVEKKCNNKHYYREDFIENYLKENLLTLFQQRILESQNCTTKKIINKSNEYKNKLNKLTDLYLSDLIQKDKYELEYKKYEAEYKKALEQEKEIRKPINVKKIQDFISNDMMKIYDELTDEEKKRFWRNIIDKIIITDKDNIKIEILGEE